VGHQRAIWRHNVRAFEFYIYSTIPQQIIKNLEPDRRLIVKQKTILNRQLRFFSRKYLDTT